jgi:hypothetical protein
VTKHSHRQPKLFNIRTHCSTSIISFACHFECNILHYSFIEPLSVETVRSKGRNCAIFSKSSLNPQPGHDSFTGTVSLCITRSVTHTRHRISKVLYLSAKSRRTRTKRSRTSMEKLWSRTRGKCGVDEEQTWRG